MWSTLIHRGIREARRASPDTVEEELRRIEKKKQMIYLSVID
jgi:hypothetical protein